VNKSEFNLESKVTNSLKFAIIHAFFVVKGGGEKLILQIRDHYNADLYTGALDSKIWDKNNINNDSFSKQLFSGPGKFVYLHEDSKIPIWRKIQRQLAFLLNKKINDLKNYDVVIFSGNIGIVPFRLRNAKTKLVVYCHTPPRPFTDQLASNLAKYPFWFRPFANLFAKIVVWQYRQDMLKMDLIISNSENTQKRLKDYVGIDSKVIFPAVETERFTFLGQQDYYISHSRLEPLKRTELIIEAFAKMPDKKLVVCSTGPLKDWVKNTIKERNLTNITFEGLVTDERLNYLVGNCIAGITIPINEDAGITQCEIMSAGKPVIGVAEGALVDTIIDGKTGVLIPANPTVEDLIKAVKEMTPEKAFKMREASRQQSLQFSSENFFKKMDEMIGELFE
jgi:glycosyltransferase involved in cell wall biosynthesis